MFDLNENDVIEIDDFQFDVDFQFNVDFHKRDQKNAIVHVMIFLKKIQIKFLIQIENTLFFVFFRLSFLNIKQVI